MSPCKLSWHQGFAVHEIVAMRYVAQVLHTFFVHIPTDGGIAVLCVLLFSYGRGLAVHLQAWHVGVVLCGAADG